MRIAQEEIFGPVGTVLSFSDLDDAVRLANDTIYGLSASVWTCDISLAHRAAGRLQAGTMWVNNWGQLRPELPFGGLKQSGIGRENGREAIDMYTETKAVQVTL